MELKTRKWPFIGAPRGGCRGTSIWFTTWLGLFVLLNAVGATTVVGPDRSSMLPKRVKHGFPFAFVVRDGHYWVPSKILFEGEERQTHCLPIDSASVIDYSVAGGLANLGIWFAILIAGMVFCASVRRMRKGQVALAMVVGMAILAGTSMAWCESLRRTARTELAAAESLRAAGSLVTTVRTRWFGLVIPNTDRVEEVICFNNVRDRKVVASLKSLADVTHLSVCAQWFGDDDLCAILHLESLWYLDLSQTKISAKGLGQLHKLRSLRTLCLCNLRVIEHGLASIGQLDNLECLSLNGSNVDDAGLEGIHSLKKVQKIWLLGTKVTAVGVARLHQALPACSIESNWKSEG